jgi:diguanylate cyclase (GGDEF)-like protein
LDQRNKDQDTLSNLSSSLRRYALAVSLMVLIAFPLGFGYAGYQTLQQQVNEQSRFSSLLLQDLDLQNDPDRDSRIRKALEPANAMYVSLHDNLGDEIYRSASNSPSSPQLVEQNNLLHDNRQLVATVTVSASLRPLLIELLFVLALSALFSAIIYRAFNKLPIHEVNNTQQQLSDAQTQIQELLKDKEKALRKVQYSTETIRHLATHDLLTDLPNRPYLESQLRSTINQVNKGGPPFALVMLDINRFKEINDTLGHHCGDLVIREISRRLKEAVPDANTIARVGGDEFGILITDVGNIEEAQERAHAITQTLERPYIFQGFSLDTSASLGLAMFPEHGQTPDQLIQRADVAMYLAKGTGKDLVVYRSEIDPNSVSQLTLRGELRETIESGSLELYYQPKIDVKTNIICGVEALVRWQHPERGMISPVNFIPVAEQTGLIHPLTNLVFNKAMQQAAHWQDSIENFKISVNLSARSLHDPQLPARLHSLIQAWQVTPQNIILEITESAIMAEPARAERVLNELSEMGMYISIDDYGTGYSSLSYIKRLPINEIKIDSSFVFDMKKNENDSVIVRATIDMAHDLGLYVTAEGVEDQETWDMLSHFGCDQAQGFFMGRPQPANKLNEWMHQSPWGISQPLRLVEPKSKIS